MARDYQSGFTLIELSIVLVIIGLVVGGILVGADLISAAAVRAQVSQIERYRTATNTFQAKYGSLPGDLPASAANALGFVSRTGTINDGDDNGMIACGDPDEWAWTGNPTGLNQGGGETALFWDDLSSAGLLEGNYTQHSTGGYDFIGFAAVDQWFPDAKMGNQNKIYVYSWQNINYFGLSAAYQLSSIYVLDTLPALTVSQAYAIDTKMDDGLPQSGSVTARYVNWDGYDIAINYPRYATGGNSTADLNFSNYGPDDTSSTPQTQYTCFDNGGQNGQTQTYSMSNNNGQNMNCALSFKFE